MSDEVRKCPGCDKDMSDSWDYKYCPSCQELQVWENEQKKQKYEKIEKMSWDIYRENLLKKLNENPDHIYLTEDKLKIFNHAWTEASIFWEFCNKVEKGNE